MQDISSATTTAISITTALTLLETTGTNAATSLADGTVVGQIKIIVHDTAGGTSEMTPADPMGYVDVDFASLGDSFTCIWREHHALHYKHCFALLMTVLLKSLQLTN